MIVNGFCKEMFPGLSMVCAIDALKDVATGVNALRSPERAIILVTHYTTSACSTTSSPTASTY